MGKRSGLVGTVIMAVTVALLVGSESPAQSARGDIVATLVAPARVAATGEAATIAVYRQPDAETTSAYATTAVMRAMSANVGSGVDIDVPDGWFHNGWANVTITARVGSQWTLWDVPVPQGKQKRVTLGADPKLWFKAADNAAAAKASNLAEPMADCTYSYDTQQPTRIGEMHLADVNGMRGRFVYSVNQDSDFETGVHFSGQNWEVSGSKHMSGSLATSAGVTFKNGARRYLNSHFVYRMDALPQDAACSRYLYKTYPYRGLTDVFRGPNRPGVNPRGNCHDWGWDHWWITIAKDGTWHKTTGEGTRYDGVARTFGFQVGGHTGWTSHVRLGYNNQSNRATYACGNGEGPGEARTIYNNPW